LCVKCAQLSINQSINQFIYPAVQNNKLNNSKAINEKHSDGLPEKQMLIKLVAQSTISKS